MKILMISGDKHILIPGTVAYMRFELQKAQVEQLDVFVWPQVHAMREISAAAFAGKYDVIIAQDPFWRGLLAWHLARKTGAKLNIQVHTDLSAEAWFRRTFASFLLRRVDSIRVVSEKLKEEITPHVQAPISVLPVYVDASRFVGLTRTTHPRFKKTILWVGRFEKEKNPGEAISILKTVREAGVDAGLIMLGSGSLDRSLRALAKDLSVEFPGWQDPVSYTAMADVVVCTSLFESYGVSIIDALSAGVPVVAPDVGIAKEAGAIVVPRNGLASEVIRVLQSGERGVLTLPLLNEVEWAHAWKETLI